MRRSSVLQKRGVAEGWPWPIPLDGYDRTATVTPHEDEALVAWLHQSRGRGYAWGVPAAARLVQPMTAVLDGFAVNDTGRRGAIHVLAVEMQRRGVSFWAWSPADWQETLAADAAAFGQRYGWHFKPSDARNAVGLLAYVLCGYLDSALSGRAMMRLTLARKVFGTTALTAALDQITAVLFAWGYTPRLRRHLLSGLCYVLLLNRSPRVDDLTLTVLTEAYHTAESARVRTAISQVSRALAARGVIDRPLGRRYGHPSAQERDPSLSEEWLRWCQRWLHHSTYQQPRQTYYCLLKVGRWLQTHHPEIVSPAAWTTALAAEFVAAVDQMRVGDYIHGDQHPALAPRLGHPLHPQAKAQMLQAVRVFLIDCQEWAWIPVRLNPARCLRTPRAIKCLIGPDPRVIDHLLWAKLVWAALNVAEEDLPRGGSATAAQYPLALVRALAVVWCFAALRADEIRRLRVGCVRWQREDVVVPETGEALARDAVCFLDIPVNKTSTAYTKPTHPLVGQRIAEWERVRPPDQLPALDAKTSEHVHYLFSYRGRRIGTDYLNGTLIPLLCRKAGIPDHDARGKITSHRARATIASLLYNAKEPLSLYELMEYLGHKRLSSTQHYAKVDRTKLANSVAKAGYLEQNMATIAVLLDQEAVLSGAAAAGATWKYYDLGHGYCTHTFWATCQHRMACARCPFYRPKGTMADALVEGKANLVRMLEFVTLTEDERLLVEEGVELHQALIETLRDVPTPAGPTPRQLAGKEVPVIPVSYE